MTGELSDRYPNLFVPAGFTFAIWGLIYLLLLDPDQVADCDTWLAGH